MGEVRVSKTDLYVSDGPPPGIILVSKTDMYVAEGPAQGTMRVSKTTLYISEGPGVAETTSRRRGFMSFSP